MSEIDATAPKYLRDKYAIIGVGETTYTRGSGMTTRALGTWAVKNAMEDAGIPASEIDGMMSYSGNDSTASTMIAGDLGIRLNFYMDVMGGGSSSEALIGLAMGAIEAGMCNTVVVFRSMNGYSQVRIGGTGARAAQPVGGDALHTAAYGWFSAGQNFSPSFMRHMYDYGTTPEQVAMVKVIHSEHASEQPEGLLQAARDRRRRDQQPHDREAAAPARLLRRDRQRHRHHRHPRRARLRATSQTPARILGVAGRVCKPRIDMHFQHGPISTVAGYYIKDIIWPNSGIGPEDIDVTGAYDAFTFTSMLQLEDYGFCKKGEGGDYVSSGIMRLGGERPNNTSGGHLCEGYTHGMNMIIENVRQLRGEVDDYCPVDANGKRQHTYEYVEQGCRQVRDVNITMNLGWAMPGTGSSLVMRKG